MKGEIRIKTHDGDIALSSFAVDLKDGVICFLAGDCESVKTWAMDQYVQAGMRNLLIGASFELIPGIEEIEYFKEDGEKVVHKFKTKGSLTQIADEA